MRISPSCILLRDEIILACPLHRKITLKSMSACHGPNAIAGYTDRISHALGLPKQLSLQGEDDPTISSAKIGDRKSPTNCKRSEKALLKKNEKIAFFSCTRNHVVYTHFLIIIIELRLKCCNKFFILLAINARGRYRP